MSKGSVEVEALTQPNVLGHMLNVQPTESSSELQPSVKGNCISGTGEQQSKCGGMISEMEGGDHSHNHTLVSKSKPSDIKRKDMSYMNGFYTIADTMHKENAHSAVTNTTTTQVGEIRMSSKIAESANHEKQHNERTSSENELSEENSLKELSQCVEQIILEDENLLQQDPCSLSNVSRPISNSDSNLTELDVFCGPSNQYGNHPENLKDGHKDVLKSATCCGGHGHHSEELPGPLSDFVLGYDKGLVLPAMQVPADDSDLDTILTDKDEVPVMLVPYESELQMPDIMRLITKDLSEPYSIYTYRYFIHNWPDLCFLAMHGSCCVGAIVCKLDVHKKVVRRGYIAMLAVDENYRKQKLGSSLVRKAIRAMIRGQCDEVVLETEITNKPALRLYENLGFLRDKRLFRYYLNGVDALRLKLWLR